MEALKLKQALVTEICDIKLEVEKNVLTIVAVGITVCDGWEKPNLVLRELDMNPMDGIYDFDFYGQGPEYHIGDAQEKVMAIYKWSNFPKDLNGVRIHADRNSILLML